MAEHTQRDWIIGAGGFLLVLVLAVLSHVMQWPRIVEILGDILTGIFGLVGAYFIYKASDMLGGDLARYISIMGVGIAYYSITLVPHVYGHLSGVKSVGPIKMLTLFMWQHVVSIWVFVLIAYGLYLFWKGGKQ
ncbi:MAG: hypothetical protein ABEJ95_06530 [Candidatus Nanohalobium sp.]